MQVEELNHTNCKTYLLTSGGHAALVDPVRERVDTYRRVIAERGLELDLIIETHMHADHLMINRELKEALGAPVFMHRGDERIELLHTPGHTPDSLCLRIPGAVLTGDTLLIGGSGRTDFPGGDAGAQYDAVTGRLFAFPDDTVVWPGHDYKDRVSSTIGDEKRENSRFKGRSRDEYVELMRNLGLPFPDRIQDALQTNQSGFEADQVQFPQVEEIASVSQVDAPALSEQVRSASPPLVLDVREPEEFVGELGHIEGAILVPMDALRIRLPKLAGYTDREVVVVCRSGVRSASVSAILQRAGFQQVANLRGGMLAWARAGLPVQR
jgi:glyoxylase-like metal-dependent hydrolase (beta-lactamase superfamily II)/rhodanese-related sulfurtransferase